MRELAQRNFTLIYFRAVGPDSRSTDVTLARVDGVLKLRVTRGNAISEYSASELLPSGIPAGDAVMAWVKPDRRQRLAALGFWVNSFTDPCASDELLAAEFLGHGQRPGHTAVCPY